ncbi:MAG: hypothetical protein ACLRJV_22285 [Eubacteriales bacterium]
MDASNDIMIRISPRGQITVEEDAQGVFSRKSITEEDLLRCFKDSLRTADEGYHSGFLPLNTISLYQSETVKRFVLWHPRLYADVSVYDTPYPHFPIPRLVFGFSLNQEGKASHCRIGWWRMKSRPGDTHVLLSIFQCEPRKRSLWWEPTRCQSIKSRTRHATFQRFS